MANKKIYALLVAAAIASGTAAAAEKVLFREDFNRFEVGTKSSLSGKDEIVAGEDGNFARSHSYSWMFGKENYFGAQRWENYRLQFKVRFPTKNKFGGILILRNSGRREPDKKFQYLSVVFGSSSSGFNHHGEQVKLPRANVRYSDIGMAPLQANVWYKVTVTLNDDHFTMSIAAPDGTTHKIFDHKVQRGGGGANLCAHIHPTEIADITVTEI